MKLIVASIALAGVVGGLLWWSADLQKNDPEILSSKGIHWHPELKIFVKGAPIEIPEDLGLGAVHNPMHTHEDLPIIHLEFEGLVKKQDITLGKFFTLWGKDMRSLGTTVRMMVSGVENTEYESYIFKEGDKVELYYD